MYGREIARVTRDHAETHLAAYLVWAVGLLDKPIVVPPPRLFTVTSFVGGMAGVSRTTMPAMAVDAYDKRAGTDLDDLSTNFYLGHIVGLVTGKTAEEAESIAICYGAAFERFAKEHRHLSHADMSAFRIIEFLWSHTDYFGAAQVPEGRQGTEGKRPGRAYWVDGFVVDVGWQVSEGGPYQHA